MELLSVLTLPSDAVSVSTKRGEGGGQEHRGPPSPAMAPGEGLCLPLQGGALGGRAAVRREVPGRWNVPSPILRALCTETREGEVCKLDTWVLLGGEMSRRGGGGVESAGSCSRKGLWGLQDQARAKQTPREPSMYESPDVSEACFKREMTLLLGGGWVRGR